MKSKSKLITFAEAIRQMDENYQRHQAEVEAQQLAEAERYRLDYYTSIVCGHRDAKQGYVTVAEFDFQLCPECVKMITEALADNE